MHRILEVQVNDGEIYLAGHLVPAGKYRQIGGSREIRLDHEDILPASLDGRVACYEPLPSTWAEHGNRNRHSSR